MPSPRRDDIPPPTGPTLKIFRLKANKSGTFALFGSRVHGFWTHWAGGCSEPCTEPIENCVGHQRQWPLRWKGYLHCHWQERAEEGFLELTPVARDELLLLLGGEEELRGSRVTVARGGGDKSRLKIGIMPRWKAWSGTEVPPEKDPENTLIKLWEFGNKLRKNPAKEVKSETVS